MPKEIKRWKCDHCKKNFASRGYANRHEYMCFFNPKLKTCPTCDHFNVRFNLNTCRCNKLNRTGIDQIPCELTESGFTDKYNVFTEFLIYNCESWKSIYDDGGVRI